MVRKYDGRGKARSINKLRNLPQYKNATDEELEEILARQKPEEIPDQIGNMDERIDEMMAKFSEDYDLSDLKINDMEVLRGMIRDIISSQDYDIMLFKLRSAGINPDNLILVDKLQKTISDLKDSISKAQNDLNITRKHRRSDQEASVLAYIESLKAKARKFYESRMSYVFCEKCNTLLGTIWTLYPEQDNKLSFVCQQLDKEGKPCGHRTVVDTKSMIKNRGTNNREAMPDSLL